MKPAQRIYLQTTPLHDALQRWKEFLKGLSVVDEELIKVTESLNRITSRAVFARVSSPFFTASAMDGFAVRFQDTFGASEVSPLRLKLKEQAVEVSTGEPLPEGFNAVIMVEDTYQEGECIVIHQPVTPYQNVRTVGEDIVQTELILPEKHKIRPVDIGAMLAGGNSEVWVRKRPLVSMIPTGSEVIDPWEEPGVGSVLDYNSFMLGNMIIQWGGVFHRFSPVSDDIGILKETIMRAVESSDVVAVIAGSSAGKKDLTPDVVAALGEIIVHGVSMKPGKPVLLGSIKGKPVIGVPGYPVSAYIVFDLFCKPLIFHLLGLQTEEPETIKARMSRPVSSPLGQTEFLRVKVGRVDDKLIATPVGRGAGALMTIQRADGIVQIPEESEGIGTESEVDVVLLRTVREIDNTVVCIGSHDNTLDILANYLRRRYPAFSLSSAHVGSMGGIMAIKRKEAHIGGTHLLDEETEEYNIPFIKRLLKGVPLKLINLHYRQQGLIVKKGNPKGIKGIEDLRREDIIFVNRQRGSGTRLLTDKVLREAGISPSEVNGYEREEFTHMGVASKVASGAADVGMGILTAARALDLDFIPVTRERYDLIFPDYSLRLDSVKAVLDIITSDSDFRRAVEGLGGYDTTDMGKVMYEQ